jgi:hypothetical protein
VGLVLAGFDHVPILREFASLLIVENSLKPAAAIVAMGGQAPFRQIEAAKLYHTGWAPLVFIVREGASDESEALQELGIKIVPEWELSREVLIRKGVPASAIIISEDKAAGTLEELQAVWAELSRRSEVGNQRSEVGGQRSEISAKTQNATNADNATNALV